MGHEVSSLNLPNDPKRCCKQCVEVWRNFIHSYPISCGGLLGCRTLEDQGFSVEPEGPPSPPKHLQQPWFISQHIATAHLSQMTNMVPDIARFCLSLALEPNVGWTSTMAYGWPQRISVVYCNAAYCSDKTNIQKSDISTKIDVYTATRGLTDVPFVVLAHSVGVVGQ
jgi:hypothetical protein